MWYAACIYNNAFKEGEGPLVKNKKIKERPSKK